MNDTARRYSYAILSHALLLLAWYLFVEIGKVPNFVMPSPQATLGALFTGNYRWWDNVFVTGVEIFGGYPGGRGRRGPVVLLVARVGKRCDAAAGESRMIRRWRWAAHHRLVFLWLFPNMLIAFPSACSPSC